MCAIFELNCVRNGGVREQAIYSRGRYAGDAGVLRASDLANLGKWYILEKERCDVPSARHWGPHTTHSNLTDTLMTRTGTFFLFHLS